MPLMRNITVVDYNPQWPLEFSEEAGQIRSALADVVVALHHIGSTSVPQLAAKPVIDMLLLVRDLDELDRCNRAMIDLGYQPKGELGIAGRRFFSKGTDDQRTHHVHAFEPGNSAASDHLAFRNYLRAKPQLAQQYGRLKAKLAEEHSDDIEAYMVGKDPLIRELLQDARRLGVDNDRS